VALVPKKPPDFGGNLDDVKLVMVRVGLGLRLGGVPPCSAWEDLCFVS